MTEGRERGESEERVPRRRSKVLATFAFRDFRLLWSGLLVSNLGTWMQFTALGFYVVKLAGSSSRASLDVGILGACSAVPALLFSPLAGVVADRYPRRRVLLVTNSAISLFALVLAVLASQNRLVLWEILVISVFRSATQSFDSPVRQSWVPLLVPREYVGNAIGLNSVAFNAPSVVGPPIAGLLILSSGVAAAFYINAAATLAVVVALLFMKPAPPSSLVRESVWQSLVGGMRFLASHPILRPVALLLVVTCLCVRPYTQLLPAYAAHVVFVNARGLGELLAATGCGAIGGSLVTALVGSRRRGVVWFASAGLMSLGTVALGFVHAFGLALIVLFVIGLATLSFAGSSNVLFQSLSPPEMRGRSISAFTMIVLGLVPTGSLLLGSLASVVGLSRALAAGGALAFAVALAVFFGNASLREV